MIYVYMYEVIDILYVYTYRITVYVHNVPCQWGMVKNISPANIVASFVVQQEAAV